MGYEGDIKKRATEETRRPSKAPAQKNEGRCYWKWCTSRDAENFREFETKRAVPWFGTVVTKLYSRYTLYYFIPGGQCLHARDNSFHGMSMSLCVLTIEQCIAADCTAYCLQRLVLTLRPICKTLPHLSPGIPDFSVLCRLTVSHYKYEFYSKTWDMFDICLHYSCIPWVVSFIKYDIRYCIIIILLL